MIPANFITGKQAIDLVKSGQITVPQIIKDHQDRYLERGALLNAWVTVNHDECIRNAEATPNTQSLAGMMVGVKDIIGELSFKQVDCNRADVLHRHQGHDNRARLADVQGFHARCGRGCGCDSERGWSDPCWQDRTCDS